MAAQRHRQCNERDAKIAKLRAAGLSIQALTARFGLRARQIGQICYRVKSKQAGVLK